jgi:hypothetical protein
MFEIVGIVANMRYGNPADAPAPGAFLAYEQTAGNGPPNSVPAVKAAIWRMNPAQLITDVRTAANMFGRATATRRFNMLLMIIFAALADHRSDPHLWCDGTSRFNLGLHSANGALEPRYKCLQTWY